MPGRVVIALTAAPAYRLITGQVRSLVARGWEVHVVVGESVDEVRHPDATVHVLPMRRGPAPAADCLALASWLRLLRETRPAVVVGATPKAGLLSLAAAAAAGIPHRVWWVWGLRSEAGGGPTVRAAEHATARMATSIVAASPSLAGVIPSGRGTSPIVLGFGGVAGVDLQIFTAAAATDSCAPAIGPTSNVTFTRGTSGTTNVTPPPTVAFVGRLAADKGIVDLARVWPLVTARLPEARLLLAGAEDHLDAPGASLDRLCGQRGVTRLDYVDDVPQLLRQADVLCLPSWREGMPAVVLEAAACEVPTVAWDVTGTRDAVLDGQTGYLIPIGDHVTMADRLVERLSAPERRRQMGAAARRLVTERFDRDHVESLFAEYLESLVGGNRPSDATRRHVDLDTGSQDRARIAGANLGESAS
ncbi:MAG: hypothetical protein QG671_2244 [Actinomycetota bacterium]|nr:hypothetical protein [Actinomycetota bacterium]